MTSTAPLLLHVYPTFDLGGAQRRFVLLANHFGPAFRHRIVSMTGGTEAFSQLSPDLDARMEEVGCRPRDTIGNLGRIRAVLKRLKPDLMVTSNWGSIEWAMANIDGLVRHLHMEDGFGPEEATRQLPRRVWIRRLLLRRSTVMLPSRTLYRLASAHWRLPAKNLIWLPNGVDCDRFAAPQDPAVAASFGIATDRPVVGTVAALRPEKNVGRLIEAFALVRRRRAAQLVIIGDGPQRAQLEKRAADLGIGGDVVFTGGFGAPEKLLPALSLFALSSDTEQMPLSLLEAMAAGLAVVATDVGDIADMVAGENRGFVVPVDAGKLSEGILGLLEDEAARRAIGAANARRAREAFALDRMVERYHDLFVGLDSVRRV